MNDFSSLNLRSVWEISRFETVNSRGSFYLTMLYAQNKRVASTSTEDLTYSPVLFLFY